jgi:hypothetical protein
VLAFFLEVGGFLSAMEGVVESHFGSGRGNLRREG